MSGTPIALLTDYGVRDAYVGILRSVIHSTWPWATILDLCHEVPPQNVMSGAWMLVSSSEFLPHGSIVCAVVDPGVGSARRAVAVETKRLRLVAPDNGLLALLLAKDPAVRAVELDCERWFLGPAQGRKKRSATFDGRDVFAPVAAQLARGVRFEALGTSIDPASLAALAIPEVDYDASRLEGRVLHIDRFGNVITTIDEDGFNAWRGTSTALQVSCAGASFPVVRTFSDVAVGDVLSYIGSAGHLELGLRDGDCAAAHGIAQGDTVMITR